MHRDLELLEGLVVLGRASEETRGSEGPEAEIVGTQPSTGLFDD